MSTAPTSDSSLRSRIDALGSPWSDGERRDLLVAVVDHAELTNDVAREGARLTAGRVRRMQHGNADLAADDAQFQRVIGEAAARAAVATAAAESVVRGAEEATASVRDVELAVIGLAALSHDAVRTLFDTLGASSTLTSNGLHLLWARQHELETRGALVARTLTAARAVLDV